MLMQQNTLHQKMETILFLGFFYLVGVRGELVCLNIGKNCSLDTTPVRTHHDGTKLYGVEVDPGLVTYKNGKDYLRQHPCGAGVIIGDSRLDGSGSNDDYYPTHPVAVYAVGGKGGIQGFFAGYPTMKMEPALHLYEGANVGNNEKLINLENDDYLSFAPSEEVWTEMYMAYYKMLLGHTMIYNHKTSITNHCDGTGLIILRQNEGFYILNGSPLRFQQQGNCALYGPHTWTGNLTVVQTSSASTSPYYFCAKGPAVVQAMEVIASYSAARIASKTGNWEGKNWGTDGTQCTVSRAQYYRTREGVIKPWGSIPDVDRQSAAQMLQRVQSKICDTLENCVFRDSPNEDGGYPSDGVDPQHGSQKVNQFLKSLWDKPCTGNKNIASGPMEIRVSSPEGINVLHSDRIVHVSGTVKRQIPPYQWNSEPECKARRKRRFLGFCLPWITYCFGGSSDDKKFDVIDKDITIIRNDLKELQRFDTQQQAFDKQVQVFEGQVTDEITNIYAQIHQEEDIRQTNEEILRKDLVKVRYTLAQSIIDNAVNQMKEDLHEYELRVREVREKLEKIGIPEVGQGCYDVNITLDEIESIPWIPILSPVQPSDIPENVTIIPPENLPWQDYIPHSEIIIGIVALVIIIIILLVAGCCWAKKKM